MAYTFYQYCEDLDDFLILDEQGILTEGFIEKLQGIKGRIGEIILAIKNTLSGLLEDSKTDIRNIVNAFKQGKVFEILKHFGFSLVHMVKAINEASKFIAKGVLKVFEELHKTKLAQKIHAGGIAIDEVLNRHPILKKLTGPVIAGLLLYTWLNMTFIGNLEYDMDITNMFYALGGNFSVADLFTGKEGLARVALLGTGIVSGGVLSVAWLGSATANMAAALTYISIKNAREIDIHLIKNLKQKILNKQIREGVKTHYMKKYSEFLMEDLELSKSDKQIIMLFVDQKAGSNKKFFTDGVSLEGLWMGGKDIAWWEGKRIVMGNLDSRAKQTVQRFINKEAGFMVAK